MGGKCVIKKNKEHDEFEKGYNVLLVITGLCHWVG